MKSSRILVSAIIFAVLPAFLAAQASDAVWDSEYDQWDLSISAAGGLSYGFSLAALPSLELIVASIKIDNYLPLDFGVSVRSLITKFENSVSTVAMGWSHVGIGIAATAHLSFNNLEHHSLPFMENFDFYFSVGPVYDIISFSGTYAAVPPPVPANGFGFSTSIGVRYFFLDWLSAGLELFHWKFSPGVTAGVSLTF